MVHLDDSRPCSPAEFGEQLRRTREGAGLRIEDIVAEIKVSASILEAMERGNFRRLPERVFSRSFVAQCAQTIGVDAAPLLASFDSAWEEYTAESGALPGHEVVSSNVTPSIRWRFWIPIVAGALILIGAGVMILRGSEPPDERLVPDPRRSSVRRVVAERSSAGAPPTPLLEPTSVPSPVAALLSSVDLTVAVAPGKESWIHYRDGDGKTGQDLLSGGEELTLRLTGPVKLTIGNAGAVRMTIAGKTYDDLGLPGQVIHTEVNEDGWTRLGREGSGNS